MKLLQVRENIVENSIVNSKYNMMLVKAETYRKQNTIHIDEKFLKYIKLCDSYRSVNPLSELSDEEIISKLKEN